MARFVVNYALASIIFFCVILIVYERVRILRDRVVTDAEYRRVTCVGATICAVAGWVRVVVFLILVRRTVWAWTA